MSGKALRQLDPGTRKAILDAIRAVGADRRPAGVTPSKGHRPWLRVRVPVRVQVQVQVQVGDYRIIYDVDDTTRTVTIAVVGHRREVYQGLDLQAPQRLLSSPVS